MKEHKSIFRFEKLSLLIVLILYALTIKNILPNILFVSYVLLLALYFFPIRLFVLKNEKTLEIVSSSVIVAWLLSIALVHFYVELSLILKVFLLAITLFNLFLVYRFYDKKDSKFGIHFLVLFLIPMILYQ